MQNCLIEVKQRLRRGNQILFTPANPCLAELERRLSTLSRRQVVAWAFGLACELVDTLSERYPDDPRPQEALKECTRWARGEIKMPQAKPYILALHAMAKDIPAKEDQALAHAIGQALSCIHTPGHALGLPIYHLSSHVHRLGPEAAEPLIRQSIDHYLGQIDGVLASDLLNLSWASFLTD